MFLDWQKYVMQKENVQITQNIPEENVNTSPGCSNGTFLGAD